MEALAAASSVAGILSLLNQTVIGVSKVKEFLSAVKSAVEKIDSILHEIDSLLQVLETAREILTTLPDDFDGSQVMSLAIQLDYCSKDIFRMLRTAESLRPASEIGAKAWFKRFRIATKKHDLMDVQEELGRHMQSINLSLTILGRNLDLHTAQSIRGIDQKLIRNAAASSAMIEEQNAALERIESYTEVSIAKSGRSDQSLHSIATSLSRIEAMAYSVASASKSQKGSNHQNSIRPKSHLQKGRRSTGNIAKSRRTSISSVTSARVSLASVKSLPAVPAITQDQLGVIESRRISECSEWSQGRSNSWKESQTPWTSIYTDPKQYSARLSGLLEEPKCKDVSSKDTQTPSSWGKTKPGDAEDDLCLTRSDGGNVGPALASVDVSLQQQHRLFSRITQDAMVTIYPPSVLEYISLIQVVKDYESKINILNLLKFGSNVEGSEAFQNQDSLDGIALFVLQQERNALQARIKALGDNLQSCRRRCIFEGHSLHEIDKRFGLQDCIFLPFQEDHRPHLKASQILTNEIRKHDSNLLGEWSNSRDRTNRWLLHCLKSDDQQAQLQRSMLADPPVDDEYWARQVLTHWFIDEAAIGDDLQVPLSVGAVDSHTSEPFDYPIQMERISAKPAGTGKASRFKHARKANFAAPPVDLCSTTCREHYRQSDI